MAEESKDKLFRNKALKQLERPDIVETEIKVTRPSTYVIIASMAILVIAVFVWCLLGSISDRSSVYGVIFPIDKVVDVTLPNRGTVRSTFVTNGDVVEKGRALAMVSVGEAYSMISSPTGGSILNIKKENEDFESLAPIATIISDDEEQGGAAVAFVPFEVSRKLQSGMRVEVTPKNLTREKNGYIVGHITEVERYPISRDDAVKMLKNENFVGDIFPQQGAAFVVKMELHRQDDGSLVWSFKPNEPVDMGTGTFCDIRIVTKRRSVYEYLFESLREKAIKGRMMFE
ncbi:MAG: hypothetical protein MJY69_09040 [Bacteroidales bacterium]|nr:hypothetical protein [Bacteroidales bacterium]